MLFITHTHTHTHTHTPLTVMARVVLVLVLVFSPGGGLSQALAEDCAASEDKAMIKGVQVTEGRELAIKNMITEETKERFNLFVMPESGFKGVHLDLYGSDGTHHAAWFPLESQCFQQYNKWHQAQVWANTNTDGNTSLSLGFFTWKCKMECKIDRPAPSQYNLSLVAHGASKWLTGNAPDKCHITYMSTPKNFNVTTCKNPPTPLTTISKITSGTIMKIVVISMVVLLVVVVVVVMVVFGMRKTAIPSE